MGELRVRVGVRSRFRVRPAMASPVSVSMTRTERV